MKVRRTFWVVLLLLAASIFGAAIYGSSVYYRLIYVWGLLLISSAAWTVLSLRGMTTQRRARTLRQQVGEIFEEGFELTNDSSLPSLWVEVRDTSNLPGTSGSRVLTWIGGHQKRSYLAYSWLSHRGLYNLGPTVLTSGDLFGLFSINKEFPVQDSLLIIPHLVILQSFPAPPGLLPGGRALRRRTLEATPYAAGVREYVPGDALNRIHWPSTARRDDLMVKEFEQDPQADVWIFVDAYKAAQAALPDETLPETIDKLWLWRQRPEVTLPPSTIEYAVSIAVSVGNFFIRQGQAVGLVSAGQVFSVLPAERGERQMAKMLETMAFLQGEGNLPLLGLVTAEVGYLPRGSTVILITSSMQPSIVQVAEVLEQRDMHPIFILLDAASFGGREGTAELAARLAERNVRVIRVANKDDLKSALENSGEGNISPRGWWNEGEGEAS